VTSSSTSTGPDPRRWVTLAIVITAVLITALDSSVLNVAIPTILRDFHTDLPSLQWVITGYSLTFATLLIIGGRLGDLYGRRRMFLLGNLLFGIGSLIAALSTSTPMLVIGEAVIEGMGASLLLPTSLAILSTTFEGHERTTAFAAWGAFAGAAGVFGPVVGGFLTSYYSWRWAFGINVVATPLAIVGTFIFMPKDPPTTTRARLDFTGAVMVATGMFSLVFALSEGGVYGWLRQVKPFSIGGASLWPRGGGLSIIPVSFAVALTILTAFVFVERAKERRNAAPLFEFGQLRHKRFRYGLITTMVVTMGGFTLLIVLPVFLQQGRHLSAVRNGLWQLPAGVFTVIGAQVGARLTRTIGVTTVVRIGLALQATGMLYIAFAIGPDLSFLRLMAGFAFTGMGGGFSFSQLTNVVLWDISRERSGMASGANTTSRQVGAALGVAISGALLALLTTRFAVSRITSAVLPGGLKDQVLAQLHSKGVSFVTPAGTSAHDATVLNRAFLTALGNAARVPLLVATGFVVSGVVMSLLIPHVGALPVGPGATVDAAEGVIEAFDPIDPDPSTIIDDYPVGADEPMIDDQPVVADEPAT
jgi:EmrB/QacA subfamily drug resistance transporter